MHRAQSTRCCRDQAPGDAGTPGTTSKWGKVQNQKQFFLRHPAEIFFLFALILGGVFFLVWFRVWIHSAE